MKEIQHIAKDKIVIEKQAQQEKQNKFVGRIRPSKGHTLYQVNLKTGAVDKAAIETLLEYTGDIDRSLKAKKVMVNQDCVYVSALNVKNVIKKLIKAGYINA